MASRITGTVAASLVLAAALSSVAWAADPIASGTVGSGGQTNACLDQQHSGVDPGAATPAGIVQIADTACPAPSTVTPSGGTGSSTSGGSPSGGGGGGSSTDTTQSSSSTSRSATASRHTAGFSGTTSVAAPTARGVKIVRIRYEVVRAKHGKRLRVLVTLRDRQGRLVRYGIVSLGRLAGAKTTLPSARIAFTNTRGQAALVVPVTKAMLGRRLMLRIGARTPRAHVLAVGAVLIPKKLLRHRALRHITYD